MDGLERIRISSIEASQIDDAMIDVLNRSDKMCRHLHIPLQAGDDSVLKRMRRKYTTEEFAAKIKRIREVMPGVAITTDVIVGFPGETEEMFERGFRSNGGSWAFQRCMSSLTPSGQARLLQGWKIRSMKK